MKLALVVLAVVATACVHAETGSTNERNQRQARKEQANKPQDDVVTIPLERIWAWDMPGTIDIRSLEPESFGETARAASSAEQLRLSERSLLSQVLRPLAASSVQKAGPGFAVKGTGADALKHAWAVLANKQKPAESFRPEDDISVVFFSRMFGTYVHLEEIRRKNSRVEIRYEFVPHFEAQQTVNFALIPFGNLPPGEVTVDVVRLPLAKKFIDMGIAPISQELESRIVCKSFRFVVKGAP